MTPEQQLHIRAELARRMGYSIIQSGTYFYLIDPHGSKQENADGYAIGSTSEDGAWMDAPDPFTFSRPTRFVLGYSQTITRRFVALRHRCRKKGCSNQHPFFCLVCGFAQPCAFLIFSLISSICSRTTRNAFKQSSHVEA